MLQLDQPLPAAMLHVCVMQCILVLHMLSALSNTNLLLLCVMQCMLALPTS